MQAPPARQLPCGISHVRLPVGRCDLETPRGHPFAGPSAGATSRPLAVTLAHTRPSRTRSRNTDWLNPAGGLTEPTGPDNIHVTKSPGTLLQRKARRIQRGECPQPCFHTGRNIHTHKSPRPLSLTMARRILRLILLTRLRSNDPP